MNIGISFEMETCSVELWEKILEHRAERRADGKPMNDVTSLMG